MINKLFSYDTVFWLLLMIMIVAGTIALMFGRIEKSTTPEYVRLSEGVYMVVGEVER